MSGSDDDSDAERTPVSRAQETEHLETVNAGYEGRARRGVSKPGGYDETPKRRGPQKKRRQTVRIRYVEDERRKGGTLEQMIEVGGVGRVSVHTATRQRREGESGKTRRPRRCTIQVE